MKKLHICIDYSFASVNDVKERSWEWLDGYTKGVLEEEIVDIIEDMGYKILNVLPYENGYLVLKEGIGAEYRFNYRVSAEDIKEAVPEGVVAFAWDKRGIEFRKKMANMTGLYDVYSVSREGEDMGESAYMIREKYFDIEIDRKLGLGVDINRFEEYMRKKLEERKRGNFTRIRLDFIGER